MIISVIEISPPTSQPGGKGRSYQKIQVAYKNQEGKVLGKDLVSFNNPEVFNYFANVAKSGDVLEITSQKNDKGFYEWLAVIPATGAVAPEASASKEAPAGKKFQSTYETPEERAIRRSFEAQKHVDISRQGAINSAIHYFELVKGKPEVEEVLAVAKQLNDWALNKATPKSPE